MLILGINHDMYISSAALIKDGKIIAACPEERLAGEKRTRRFPASAVQFCLDQAGCKLSDVQYIASSYNPAIHMAKFHPLFSNQRRFRGDYLYAVPDHFCKFLNANEKESDYMKQTIKFKKNELNIYYLNHHECHAANGFFLSPFQDAAILTVDGKGEAATVTFGVGHKNHIKIIKQIEIPQSVGSFYSTFTSFLGFRPDYDEWKVMALSAFGKRDNIYYEKLKQIVTLCDDGSFELDLTYFKEFVHEIPNHYTDKFIKLFGESRGKQAPYQKRHYEIAAAMQQMTEDILTHMLNWLHEKTKMKNVVLSGGSFMNSIFNGKIRTRTYFKDVFISSCPDDSGLSIGAALYLYNHILKKEKRYVQMHNYYGPGYSDSEIEKALKKYHLGYKRVNDISKVIGKELARGKLVGWFQGRMEFGQRALGNRSILADPRCAKMKDKINNAVKCRESFRPFAPAILEKYVQEYFDIPKNERVPFMEKVYPFQKKKRKSLPAVCHNDGSGRLQTVSRRTNPKFYALIKEFYAITNVPIIVNTSFNLNDEPIVCSPTDAIRTFFSCGLDILVLNNFVVVK